MWQAIVNWFNSKSVASHITVASLLGLFGTLYGLYQAVPSFAAVINDGYASLPAWTKALATAAVGIYLYYKNTSTKPAVEPSDDERRDDRRITLSLLVLALLFSAVANAQTPTFVASSDLTAYHYNSAWTVGNHTTESLDFLDWGATKSNRLFLSGDEFLAPAAGVGLYSAGLQVQPDISGLVNKTNFPSGSLQVFLSGGMGAGTIAPGAPNHVGGFFGVGGRYQVTPNLSWSTAQFNYLIIGSAKVPTISSGIYYAFNPSAAGVAKFEARKLAKAQATLAKAARQ